MRRNQFLKVRLLVAGNRVPGSSVITGSTASAKTTGTAAVPFSLLPTSEVTLSLYDLQARKGSCGSGWKTACRRVYGGR